MSRLYGNVNGVSNVEEWRPVPTWEQTYEVSNQGRVRHARTLRIKSQNHIRSGMYVIFGTTDRRQTISVHKLVMWAFVGPRPKDLVVRHLDGNFRNNMVENLAYGTPSQNSLDTLEHGTHPEAFRTHCPHGHAYDEGNTYYRKDRPGRLCRECMRANVLRQNARQKELRAIARSKTSAGGAA